MSPSSQAPPTHLRPEPTGPPRRWWVALLGRLSDCPIITLPIAAPDAHGAEVAGRAILAAHSFNLNPDQVRLDVAPAR